MVLEVGLKALFQPEFDDGATKKAVRDLEKDIDEVEELDLDIDLSGVEDKLSKLPTQIDFTGKLDNEFVKNAVSKFDDLLGVGLTGTGGRGMTSATSRGVARAAGNHALVEGGAGVAAGKLGKSGTAARGVAAAGASGGAAAGGGLLATAAAVAIPVALAGAVSIGILKGIQKIAGYSPKATKAFDMLGKAWELAWRPLGDLIGSILMPYAEGALKAMAGLNRYMAEDGFVIGGLKWLSDLLKDIPGKLAQAFIQSVGGGMEWLLGDDFGLKDFSWDDYVQTPVWGDIINALTWTTFINPIAWGGFVAMLVWDTFMDELDWFTWVSPLNWGEHFSDVGDGELLKAIGWPNIGVIKLLDSIGWPTITKGDILGALGIPGFGNKNKKKNKNTRGKVPTPMLTTVPEAPTVSSDAASVIGMGTTLTGTRGIDSMVSNRETRRSIDEEIDSGGFGLPDNFKDYMGFASGGIVKRPTRGIVAEAGPEAVIPLEDFQGLAGGPTSAIERSPPRDMGMDRLLDKLDEVVRTLEDLDVNATVEVDGKRLSRSVKSSTEKYLNTTDVVK